MYSVGQPPDAEISLYVLSPQGVRSTLGPMARSVKDLELCLKAISTTIIDENLANTEGHLLPLPYRSVQIPNKLRFGYFIEGKAGLSRHQCR